MGDIMARRRGVGRKLVASVVVAVAACGGGDDEPADAAGLEAAARDFWADFVAGDVEGVYERLTPDCQERVSPSEFGAQLSLATTFAEALGLDLSAAEVAEIETRDVVDGRGELRVRLEVDGEPFDDGEEFDDWVHEEGSWRTEECDDGGLFGRVGDGSGEAGGAAGGRADTTIKGGRETADRGR